MICITHVIITLSRSALHIHIIRVFHFWCIATSFGRLSLCHSAVSFHSIGMSMDRSENSYEIDCIEHEQCILNEVHVCLCVCLEFFSVWFGSTIILRYTDLMHTPKSSIYLYQRAQVLVLDRAWLTYISSVVVSCFFFHQKIHTESTQFSVIVNNI